MTDQFMWGMLVGVLLYAVIFILFYGGYKAGASETKKNYEPIIEAFSKKQKRDDCLDACPTKVFFNPWIDTGNLKTVHQTVWDLKKGDVFVFSHYKNYRDLFILLKDYDRKCRKIAVSLSAGCAVEIPWNALDENVQVLGHLDNFTRWHIVSESEDNQ